MALTLEKAVSDGFFVRGYEVHREDNDAILFAGTLSHCLAFMESRMRPANEVYANAEPPPASDPFAPGVDWRPAPVDLSAAGAFRTVGEAFARSQAERAILARGGKIRDNDARTALIHKLHQAITIPHWLADITGVEAAIILDALRQQDAQNADTPDPSATLDQVTTLIRKLEECDGTGMNGRLRAPVFPDECRTLIAALRAKYPQYAGIVK